MTCLRADVDTAWSTVRLGCEPLGARQVRDFGGKRSTTSIGDLRAAATGPAPGKGTLTEALPVVSAPVQRKQAASADRPAQQRSTTLPITFPD
jgi:hypothetical protein